MLRANPLGSIFESDDEEVPAQIESKLYFFEDFDEETYNVFYVEYDIKHKETLNQWIATQPDRRDVYYGDQPILKKLL